MKYLTMTGFTVRTASDRWTLGYEGENNSRTLQIKTTDDLTDFATVNLLIDTLDCGAMTVTTVGNYKVLSMVLTAGMLGESGKKTCQLLMMGAEGTVIKKTNQFQMVVNTSNTVDGMAPDSPTAIIITDYIEEKVNEHISDEFLEGKINDWLDDHPEATTTVQDGSITEAKFSPELKILTAVNLNGLAYSANIALPVAKSYVEAVTYLNPYYYVACRDYTNTPHTNYIAIYDTSYTLVSYVYTSSTYGISNNIFNDGTRIYVDFDSGYHVSFNTSLSDDDAVLNTNIRNVAFWDNKFYGIAINANDVTVSVLESDLTTVVSSFSVATVRQALQSASIIDGILIIPTTKGLFKFIDVVNQTIIAEIPYYDTKEIEGFFKDADGFIKCCGHFYGLDGIFNIGVFDGGVNGAKMHYVPIDASTGNYRIVQNDGRYGFYEITNGTSMGLPIDTGDLIVFKNARLMISNVDNAIYSYNGNWKLTGLAYPITKSATVNSHTVKFEATNYGHFMVRSEVVIITSATTTVNVDLSDIYEKLGLSDARSFTFYVNGITAGKNIIHNDVELYLTTVVVEKTKITFYTRNITTNSTDSINAKFAFYEQIM